jgi:hypothetical protein
MALGSLADGLGRLHSWAALWRWAGLVILVQYSKYFSNYYKMLQAQKYKTQSSLSPKNAKFRKLIDKFKLNIFPFWLNL